MTVRAIVACTGEFNPEYLHLKMRDLHKPLPSLKSRQAA
jgi:hypothetical protein